MPRLPDHLQSGIVRCRFAPDGSLFVGQTGRGWGSRGKAKYGVQRLVWDGKTVPFSIHSVRLAKSGFVVRFTRRANAEQAAAVNSYQVERWRYRYQPDYGSRKYDKGPVAVNAVRASRDGTEVALDMPIEAGWMYRLRFELTGAGGEPLANRIAWYTLNRIHR